MTAWYVTELAKAAGCLQRVVLVHATFREEWPGTVEIVQEQARHLGGLPVEVVTRPGESLLDYVRRRKKWPDAARHYCTSDFKRAPINKVITRLTRKPGWLAWTQKRRVLNVMGIRADESKNRAKYVAFERDARRTNSVRIVDQWYPIFRLSEADV